MYSLQYNARAKAHEIVKGTEAKASYYSIVKVGSYQMLQSYQAEQHHSSLVL